MNKCVLLLVFLFQGISAYEFQKDFPSVWNYLDRYVSEQGGGLSNVRDEVVIKTIPRTGTNILTAIVSFLTKKNALFARSDMWEKGVLINRACIETLPHEFPILVSHRDSDFLGLENNYLIIAVRDYHDVLSRKHVREVDERITELYYEHLRMFDAWDSSKKKLIYYEDLINDPFRVIAELGEFLGCEKEVCSQLAEEFDSFKEAIFRSYSYFPGKTPESAKNLRSRYSEEEFRAIDTALFDTYLNRYAE